MSTDFRGFLKESGYLDSPAQRFFLQGSSASLRGRAKLLGGLALAAALPLSVLAAALARLQGSDRLVLALCYAAATASAVVLLDLVLALVMRPPAVQRFLAGAHWLNLIPVVGTALLFWAGLHLFDDPSRPMPARVLVWGALMLIAAVWALPPRMLVVSRLYWYGLRPPTYQAMGPLTLVALLLVAGLHLSVWRREPPPPLHAVKAGKVLLLAFDIPDDAAAAYADVWPQWPESELAGAAASITDFWAGLGTGTSPRVHQAGLVHFRSPLFHGPLSAEDPVQALPLAVLGALKVLEPVVGGGRNRKYVWEILDDYGLETYSLGYWHTFPAVSAHGGVLSERWRTGLTSTPYLVGLNQRAPSDRLTVDGSRLLGRLAAAETQNWSQLCEDLAARDFQMATAYFPLSDNLARLSPEARAAAHARIAAYRADKLRELTAALGEDTAIGIVLASGKRKGADGVVHARLRTNAAWRTHLSDHIDHYLATAPTILNFFGLPTDYLMYASAYAHPFPNPTQRIDYGVPPHHASSNRQQDTRYYRELKALGYIQ